MAEVLRRLAELSFGHSRVPVPINRLFRLSETVQTERSFASPPSV
ncbi:hypothetical protein [Bacteroides pyogenes]|nr:hypothetical protein [Bacteroides pyogenes]MDY4250006.1 hypothetical protein [Bacteroides pyogenes]